MTNTARTRTATARHALVVGLVACGVALAGAPVADAAVAPQPTPPATQTTAFPTGFGISNPCDGSVVSTSGRGSAITITSGQRTTAVISDDESGGGYRLIETGTGTFDALSSTYTLHANATWFNLTTPAKTFRATLDVTLGVTPTNAPYGFRSRPTSLTCAR